MRILIDLQACQTPGSRHRGIGRYSLALAQAMLEVGEQHEFHLLLNDQFAEAATELQQSLAHYPNLKQVHLWSSVAGVAEIEAKNFWRTQAAEALREQAIAAIEPDFIHIASLFEGMVDDAVTSVAASVKHIPTAVTLYDLIPLINAEPYLENQLVRRWYYRKCQSLKNADLLLAISESSRQEGLNWLALPDERVVTISSAVDQRFVPQNYAQSQLDALLDKYQLQAGYLMYTGGIDLRKNIEGLIRAYAALAPELQQRHQLAIVCSARDEDKQRLLQLAAAQGLAADRVRLTGYVPDADLPPLYQHCALFVFPSWHEGFGLPALEAMSCGAPVIASNTSSLPEVLDLPEALFDPYDSNAIASKISAALSDTEFRQRLLANSQRQAQAFSWHSCAKRALAAMEACWQRQQQAQSDWPLVAAKPRLAYVSPIPDEKSGIADYSAELLPELARYYDIDIIVQQETVAHDWLQANFAIRDVNYLLDHQHDYARVLYHFGNSTCHTHMFRLLKEIPGAVVLHDFYLSGILSHLELSAQEPAIWLKALYASHGLHTLLQRQDVDDLNEIIWRYPCNHEVLNRARGVIVHSQFSGQLARHWYTGLSEKSWRYIPHLRILPQVVNKQKARAALGLAEDEILVCSFGILGQTKLNHRLLKAWKDSGLAAKKKLRLVFVGKNDEGPYGLEIQQLIAAAQAQEEIRITGFASQTMFREYLQAADLAVQLRGNSRGETSGTVLDCLAYGLPVIVNNNGSLGEFPDDVVLKLENEFSDQALCEALLSLAESAPLRQQLGHAGRCYVQQQHAPAQIGFSYAKAIEAFYDLPASRIYQQTLARLGQIPFVPGQDDVLAVAQVLAQQKPGLRPRRLLINLDQHEDLLENQAALQFFEQFILATPAGWRVELVRKQSKNWMTLSAKLAKIWKLPEFVVNDEYLELAACDLLWQFVAEAVPPPQAMAQCLLDRANWQDTAQHRDEVAKCWSNIIIKSKDL